MTYRGYLSDGWHFDGSIPYQIASSADQVHTVVCIRETRHQFNTYSDGTAAYRLTWEVRLVSWPDEHPFASSTFTGGDAPFVKMTSGAGYGDAPTGKMLDWLLTQLHDRTTIPVGKPIAGLAFSPDGKYLAIGLTSPLNGSWEGVYQGSARVWDLSGWRLARTLGGHSSALNMILVPAVAFSPDGSLIATGGNDSNTLLQDPASGTLKKKLAGKGQAIASVLFSPDSQSLATIDVTGQVSFWDLKSGAVSWETTITLPSSFFGGQFLGPVMAFTPDGSQLVILDALQGIVSFDVATGDQTGKIPGYGDCMAMSPDGKILALCEQDGTVSILNAQGALQTSLSGHSDAVESLVFSPNGNLLASTSKDKTVIVWNVSNWTVVRTFQGSTSEVWAAAFSPDGSLLAAGGVDGTVQVWQVK
ncbi:MAG TPA: WD40 repeat domain-containing protein [Anaerolineales bacterium]|nr:WD40 repeat domain-containing protein [Anaerolineales bacterium]